MKRSATRSLLIGLTVLAMTAGVVAGLLAARLPSRGGGDVVQPPQPMSMHPPLDRTPLAEELNLSPQQREQMRVIWEGVRDEVHASFDAAQALQRERDQALIDLLTDEQKAKFEKKSKEFADRYAALGRSRKDAFDKAVEQTRKLLDETQRAKYDEILKTHVRPEPPGGDPPPLFAPSTSPATTPGS